MEILPQLLVNSLIAGSIYALASAGLSLTYGLLRILNFAHGHIMMFGAYIFYWSTMELGQGLFVAALITGVLSIALGIFTLKVFVFPFTPFSFFLVFVTTLALSTMLESVVSLLFGVNVKSLSVGGGVTSYEWAGIYITPIQILIIVLAVVLLSVVAFIVHSTSLGRRIRALAEKEHAAQALGASRRKTSYLVFSVATLLAVLAGVLVGYETNLQPTMGNSYTIKAFAAMILGGLGNVWGTVVGSYILGLVENLSIGLEFGSFSLPAGYKDAFAFLMILLVLLVRPSGLFVSGSRKA